MPKLHPVDQPNITRPFLADILAAYELQLEAYEAATSGIENATVIARIPAGKVVVRIYRRHKKTRAEIERELDFTSYLAAAGLPVPETRRNTAGQLVTEIARDGATWSCIVMNFIAGTHPDGYTDRQLINLARTQAQLHALGKAYAAEHPAGRRPKELREGFVDQIDPADLPDAAARAFLDRAGAYRVVLPETLPFGYNHLDYDAGNILVTGDDIAAILDFDDLEYAPTIMCLGYTLWDIYDETRDPAKLALYLQEYRRHQSLTAAELDYLLPIMQFRNYVIAVIDLLLDGYHADDLKDSLKQEAAIAALDIAALTA